MKYLLLVVFLLYPLLIDSSQLNMCVESFEETEIPSDGGIFCSCIQTAGQEGVNIPIGTNAVDLEPNSRPEIGALILFDYGTTSHVAVIREFREEGFWVAEGNKTPCLRTERLIHFVDPFIVGFWTN